jgi:predicted enzyme related to lactoylglutathione lyase
MTDMNRGRFVWHDLMTTDLPKAQGFYTKVFGWGTTVWESGTTPYTMWTVGNMPMGGIMPVQNPAAPPHWLGYISVPDVDVAVKEAQSRGGKVPVPATDIPTVGRFAILGDPQGLHFPCSRGPIRLPQKPRQRPASSPGTSWRRPTSTPRSVSTKRSLAGSRSPPTTWVRWVCTESSVAAARPSAACSTNRQTCLRHRTGCRT